jgi:hypothetical protein|tara:strand:+ start:236 stop:514 length:279 start_codon:yes stop_codon:yes gene_type:complete
MYSELKSTHSIEGKNYTILVDYLYIHEEATYETPEHNEVDIISVTLISKMFDGVGEFDLKYVKTDITNMWNDLLNDEYICEIEELAKDKLIG